ncbi:MAG: ribonuclease R [Bacteroidota bacterium]
MKKKLLSFLSERPGDSFTTKEITKRLKLNSRKDYHHLLDLLQALAGQGILVQDDVGQFAYRSKDAERKKPSSRNKMTGKLMMTRRGFGFVRIEGMEEDLYISPKHLGTAFHGDVVEVIPSARSVGHGRDGDNRIEGKVVAIIERQPRVIVGTLQRKRNVTLVVPDDQRLPMDIYVDEKNLHGAKEGDKVIVEMDAWDDPLEYPEGKVIEILGRSGDVRVEVLGVAHAHGLPLKFPVEVEREAAAMKAPPDGAAAGDRLDYRGKLCVTIDPVDAKDFDDAVSFEVLENGLHRIGVHIADVSHYVREGTALDREAFARGTSVYLVNEVVPMLPEHLSNDLCSLKPDCDRYTFTVLMDVNEDGKVETYDIRKSIIHSARRFAYEEVQEIIERGSGEHAEMLLPLYRMTQVLLKRRRKNGSIDFDTGEAKFRFDSAGLPTEIIKKTRIEAHRLIEECMLLANKTVAKHIGQVKKEEQAKPFVYRVHDRPDPGRLADLAHFVKQFGYSLDVQNDVSARALQRLLDKVHGSEVETVINEVALRSMAKAVYSEKNIGHFGLAFKYYTHFTSPIRRYPDLVVHRLLEEYAGKTSPERRKELAQRLPLICRQSSERERVAVEAERDSVKVMQVEYMKRHIGDVFDGVIGGVTNFGLFVEINDLLVEGMIRVRDLADDYYLYDEKHYSLRGRSSGRVFRLGDKIRVRVASVNPEEREINFELAP